MRYILVVVGSGRPENFQILELQLKAELVSRESRAGRTYAAFSATSDITELDPSGWATRPYLAGCVYYSSAVRQLIGVREAQWEETHE